MTQLGLPEAQAKARESCWNYGSRNFLSSAGCGTGKWNPSGVLATISPPMGVWPEGEHDTGMQNRHVNTEQAGWYCLNPCIRCT